MSDFVVTNMVDVDKTWTCDETVRTLNCADCGRLVYFRRLMGVHVGKAIVCGACAVRRYRRRKVEP